MSNNSQDRFNLLFPNRTNPAHARTSLTRAEEELLADDERRNPTKSRLSGGSDEEDDFVLSQASTTRKQPKSKTNAFPQGHIAGIDPNAAVFIPSGVAKGGLSATTLDGADDDYHVEPEMSSTRLVGQFCLFNLVVKFPYKYMQDPDSAVSRAFFSAEKVYNRQWDMHYLRDPNTSKLLMFVPIGQVEKLTADINAKFNLRTSVPPYPFQVSFYEGTPSPQKLGLVNSKEEMVNLQNTVPETPEDYGEPPANATEAQQQDYATWAEKLRRSVEAQKSKKSSSKYKDLRRQMRITNDAKALLHTQRYLGLASEDGEIAPTDLDLTKPVLYPFKDEPVFTSVDIESWETDHSLITEIGVTTLDSRDLVNLEPDKWPTKVRSRHFRIAGREHLTNHRFVHGHPDHFQFGASEFIPIDDAARIVDSCFAYPFSAGYECAGPQRDENGALIPQPPTIPPFDEVQAQQKRNVILVGHAVDGDINYLSALGCTVVTSSFQFHETLDTAILYRSYKKDEANSASLAKVCQDVGIETFFLHNAGNDARYTLEAFLKVAQLARPKQSVAKVVQQALVAGEEESNNGKNEVSFEEDNKIYLEKSGLGVNERINHSAW